MKGENEKRFLVKAIEARRVYCYFFQGPQLKPV
jgi:hypothetical protein